MPFFRDLPGAVKKGGGGSAALAETQPFPDANLTMFGQGITRRKAQ